MAFLGAAIYILGYSIRAPWWQYRVGRAMVSLDAAVILTLLPSILHLCFHVNTADTFYGWWRVVSLSLVFGVTMWRLYTIDYVQRHALREPRGEVPIPEKEEV